MRFEPSCLSEPFADRGGPSHTVYMSSATAKRKVVRLGPGELQVKGVRKDEPDTERFVAALLAFVLERRAKERAARAKKNAPDPASGEVA
jgi:hypothetical protein